MQNGATSGIVHKFNLQISSAATVNSDIWRFGILNSIPFFAGGIISPLIADPLQVIPYDSITGWKPMVAE